MTGAYKLKLNNDYIPFFPGIKPGEDPMYPDGWPPQYEMEIYNVAQWLNGNMFSMKTGDTITIECLLEE